MGNAGPAQCQARHGEDPKEYILSRLHEEILILHGNRAYFDEMWINLEATSQDNTAPDTL